MNKSQVYCFYSLCIARYWSNFNLPYLYFTLGGDVIEISTLALETILWVVSYGVVCVIIHLAVLVQYRLVTDGQTIRVRRMTTTGRHDKRLSYRRETRGPRDALYQLKCCPIAVQIMHTDPRVSLRSTFTHCYVLFGYLSGVTTRGAVRQLPQGAWRRRAPWADE